VLYRANGQHTSRYFFTLPGDQFPKGLTTPFIHLEADRLADLRIAFDMFDNPLSVRTHIDAMGITTAGHPELTGIHPKEQARFARGIDYCLRAKTRELKKKEKKDLQDFKAGRRRTLPVQRSAYLLFPVRDLGMYFDSDLKYLGFAVWAHQWSDTQHSWMLTHKSIVAEMLEGWLKDPTSADTFWKHVMTEFGDDPNATTRELTRSLKDSPPKAGPGKEARFGQRVRTAWKAWLKEQEDIDTEETETPDTQPPAPIM
jgi:hypothetical protein